MSKKVLVIEDDRGFAHILEFDLKKNGYEVVTAANGEEGYVIAKAEHPDLILLDVRMPKMSGYQFVQKMKHEKDGMSKVPIIVMSASETLKKHFSGDDIFAFLDKGCPSKEFMAKVCEGLQGMEEKQG